jgi:hypothetical protein
VARLLLYAEMIGAEAEIKASGSTRCGSDEADFATPQALKRA